MRAISPEGLTPLRAAGSVVLKLTGSENDPVAILRARYRLVWNAVTRDPSMVERIGGRLFVRDSKLPALAAALGITQAQPRKARPARRAAPSSAAIAA
jgi:hypothetical protein